MDTFERGLATAIKAVTPEPPAEIDPAQITSARPSRRRAAILAPIAAGVLVAGTAAGLIAVANRDGSVRPPGSPATSAAPTPRPKPPAGSHNVEFRMAPPPQEVIGPPYGPSPACAAEQITAVAATRRTAGGVLGVVRLRGAVVKHQFGHPVRCNLRIRRGPTALVGTDGRRLDIPLAPGDETNQPANPRADIPLHYGDAIWGFAWFGSYCGPPPGAIEIHANSQVIRAPLSGPQPSCGAAGESSSLIDGIAGAPGEPVQPPRPEYSQLRLTARIRPGTTLYQLAPIDFTLRAVGSGPVILDPCPAYAGSYEGQARDGGFGATIGTGYLPCTGHGVVVDPGQPLHFTVHPNTLDEKPMRGSKVRVDVGIAGVPELHLETTVH
jgi:hypothetical protein